MKYHTAKELDGHRIRIECSGNIPVGKNVQITDLETGEPILNVEKVELSIVRREAITARLLLVHIESSQALIEHEQLTVNNPEIDLKAYVDGEQAE